MGYIKEVPKGWELKKLGQVCDIKSGKNQSKVINPNGKYPIYGSSGIFGYADEYICDAHTTIIGRKGTINSPLYVTTKFWNVDTAFGLCAGNSLNTRFLYYFCLGFNFKKLDKSTTIPSLSKTDLLSIDLPLPPLETQQAIVTKIEELFSELDKGIEDLKLAQQQLKVYRQSVLKYAFEGRLTNQNIKEGELPEGWELKKIKDISTTLGGYAFKSSDFHNDGDYQVIRMGNIRPGLIRKAETPVFVSDVHEKILSRYLLEENDVVITLTGTRKKRDYGYTALINSQNLLLNQRIAAIKFKVYSPKLFLYFSWTDSFKDQFFAHETGNVGQGNVGIKGVIETEIPFFKLEEQIRVVEQIEIRLSVADKLEESITESLQKAEALRQSILKKAFNGELVTVVKPVTVPVIKNEYFHQLQLVALVINRSKKKKIDHGEMTLAKNLYLMDAIYKLPTGFKYNRWHLGPYPPAIKKVVNNKEYFKREDNHIEILNEEKLLKYANPFQDQITAAIDDLASIFSKYNGNERSHKTELLATVCKVIEDIKSTNLAAVRESMQDWKIELKTSKFKNKAEKFDEAETEKCIGFIVERGWDRKLMNN